MDGATPGVPLGLSQITYLTRSCFVDSSDYSDRTFVFIKNIYKSKNRYNCQLLLY